MLTNYCRYHCENRCLISFWFCQKTKTWSSNDEYDTAEIYLSDIMKKRKKKIIENSTFTGRRETSEIALLNKTYFWSYSIFFLHITGEEHNWCEASESVEWAAVDAER